MTGIKQNIQASGNSFVFGSVGHQSRKIVTIVILAPDGGETRFDADVVKAEVQLLLGLSNLDAYELLADTRENALEHPNWSMPLDRQHGHLWIPWPRQN